MYNKNYIIKQTNKRIMKGKVSEFLILSGFKKGKHLLTFFVLFMRVKADAMFCYFSFKRVCHESDYLILFFLMNFWRDLPGLEVRFDSRLG